MNPLLIYMNKVALYLAAFYLIYYLFLSRDTMYNRNRFYILLSLIASFVLPFITVQTKLPADIQVFGIDLTGVVINITSDTEGSGRKLLPAISTVKIINIVYLSGIITLALKLLFEIIQLSLLIIRKRNKGNKIIRVTGNKVSGFTAFGYIFIDEVLSNGEEEEIVKHEQKHLDRGHFFDILFLELIKLFQWFNPFVYLFDISLRAVHEFQADEECLNSGIPVISYQGLMLNQVFKTRVFSTTSRFSNPTLIKKRMIMMTKKRSGALTNLKIIMVLPAVVFLLFTFSTCSKKSYDSFAGGETLPQTEASLSVAFKEKQGIKEGDAFVVVDEMPRFPGGDAALLKFIAENTQYPKEAKDKGISGRVIIRFKIMEDGLIQDVSVMNGIDPLLDNEAIRIVSTIPNFEPGRHDGVAVPVWYMVPITFTLSNKAESSPPPIPPPSPDTNSDLPSEPFVVVDEMPRFPGGDQALIQYLVDNVRYPEATKAKKIQGKVIIRFCVTKTGSVDRISVLKGVDPDLDAEAFRVVSTLPAFTPGKQGGVAVPVWYMVPVTFSINETKPVTTGQTDTGNK